MTDFYNFDRIEYVKVEKVLSMSNTIEEIFKLKNEKLYIEKLFLDIDNNADSLKLTISNYLNLYNAKIIKRISNFFNDINIEYQMQELNNIVKLEMEGLLNTIQDLVDEKTSYVKEHIPDDSDSSSKISMAVDNSTYEFQQQFKISINNELYIEFKDKLTAKYELHSEKELESLTNIINIADGDIYMNIMDSVKHRDNTLKNITLETYKKYVDLNDKTINQNKIKKKESE